MKKFILLSGLALISLQMFAQGTAFTYQGRLVDGGAAANGSYDLRFALFDAASDGAQLGNNFTNAGTFISNGLFTVTLDFGDQFSGANRWLEIGVCSNGGGMFSTLVPRQPLNPTPYAIYSAKATTAVTAASASSVAATNIIGTIPAAQLPGSVVMNGASSAGFWRTNGNAGANPTSGAFLGTTDNQPLELKANNQSGLRIEPTASGIPNLIGGASNNVTPGQMGGIIAGGWENRIGNQSSFGTISGGQANRIADNCFNATIAGGSANTIGAGNNSGSSGFSAIGGGVRNNIAANCQSATIAGGNQNVIGAGSLYSAIGGGYENNIMVNSQFATIPGGCRSAATNYAFAAGNRAQAIHTGAFVWGDSIAADIASTASNSVTMRASGGYRLFSNGDTSAGVSLAAGGTSWAVISDRNVKKDFAPINAVGILEKLAAMPMTQWHYIWETPDATPHIGPMAQDFKAAFYPDTDDKSITTLEADGVAFAAIQGLNQKLETENAELKARLEKLERLVESLAAKK